MSGPLQEVRRGLLRPPEAIQRSRRGGRCRAAAGDSGMKTTAGRRFDGVPVGWIGPPAIAVCHPGLVRPGPAWSGLVRPGPAWAHHVLHPGSGCGWSGGSPHGPAPSGIPPQSAQQRTERLMARMRSDHAPQASWPEASWPGVLYFATMVVSAEASVVSASSRFMGWAKVSESTVTAPCASDAPVTSGLGMRFRYRLDPAPRGLRRLQHHPRRHRAALGPA